MQAFEVRKTIKDGLSEIKQQGKNINEEQAVKFTKAAADFTTASYSSRFDKDTHKVEFKDGDGHMSFNLIVLCPLFNEKDRFVSALRNVDKLDIKAMGDGVINVEITIKKSL